MTLHATLSSTLWILSIHVFGYVLHTALASVCIPLFWFIHLVRELSTHVGLPSRFVLTPQHVSVVIGAASAAGYDIVSFIAAQGSEVVACDNDIELLHRLYDDIPNVRVQSLDRALGLHRIRELITSTNKILHGVYVVEDMRPTAYQCPADIALMRHSALLMSPDGMSERLTMRASRLSGSVRTPRDAFTSPQAKAPQAVPSTPPQQIPLPQQADVEWPLMRQLQGVCSEKHREVLGRMLTFPLSVAQEFLPTLIQTSSRWGSARKCGRPRLIFMFSQQPEGEEDLVGGPKDVPILSRLQYLSVRTAATAVVSTLSELAEGEHSVAIFSVILPKAADAIADSPSNNTLLDVVCDPNPLATSTPRCVFSKGRGLGSWVWDAADKAKIHAIAYLTVPRMLGIRAAVLRALGC